jgi:glutathione synthase/RimK-type ligase-like ATP-grasp enzyme
MNRNSDMASNMSKPYQAQWITRAGFKTPLTLISNDPDEVREFLRAHRQVVFKSISSVRSIVRTLSDIKVDDLDRIRYLPTQFQAYVPGVNIRVHVVGQEVFATEIQTEAVDYRYASRDEVDLKMSPIALGEIEARCLQLSRDLNYRCGIDLKRSPDRLLLLRGKPVAGLCYYQSIPGKISPLLSSAIWFPVQNSLQPPSPAADPAPKPVLGEAEAPAQ